MATILSVSKLTKAFGINPLFSDLSFSFDHKDRVAIIGPNGAGKSTLLAIMAGIVEADGGDVVAQRGTRIVYVPQEENFSEFVTVKNFLDEMRSKNPHGSSSVVFEQMGRFGFSNPDQLISELSGGWKKRLALAGSLVQEPDVLLLDEPTNHLDIDGILLLEEILRSLSTTTIFVSHDRVFIEQCASKVFEINQLFPNGFFFVTASGDESAYEAFIVAREAKVEALRSMEATLKNKVKREVEWLRRMPKARSTKAKYRIDAAHALMGALSTLNLEEKKAAVSFSTSDRQSKELIQCKDIAKAFGDTVIIKNLSLLITRKARLGVLGANGVGKSTFINLLSGKLLPDSGVLRRAAKLSIATLDQSRARLDPEVSLAQSLCPEGDAIIFGGNSVHVSAWAKRFLFKSEQLLLPVKSLSGGERARVCLAQIMSQPADLLILDEPTNDLDLSTLAVLEDALLEFPGAVVLVTHDRALLDSVCDTVVGFLGDGETEIFSDHLQWLRAREHKFRSAKPLKESPLPTAEERPKKRGAKLSYQEEREWAGILEKIERAEKHLKTLEAKPHDNLSGDEVVALYRTMGEANEEVSRLMERWEFLEKKRSGE